MRQGHRHAVRKRLRFLPGQRGAAESCRFPEDVYKRQTLHVAGLTRELTICKVNDHMDIAAFIMLGDAELTVACLLYTSCGKMPWGNLSFR